MSESVELAAGFWAVAALCGLALAFQLRSGRALDWFGLEVTRTKAAGLYWTYILLTAAGMIVASATGAHLYVG